MRGIERRSMRPIAVGVALIVGGCAAGASVVPSTMAPALAPTVSGAPSAVAIRAPLGRQSIGKPERVGLPIELIPMAGGKSLLAISQTADDPHVWARRIDGVTGVQGELLALDGERIVAAFDAADGATTIATTQGANVCLATFAAGAAMASTRACSSIAPITVARIAGRLAAIELDDSSGNTRRGPVDVRVRWASPDGTFEPTPVDAGIHFERPLAGMTIIDTASRGDQLDVLFYESVPGVRPKGKLGRARIAIATLGADGKMVARSRNVLVVGELEFGHIVGRRSPQLVTDDATTALVTLESRDGPCRVMRAAPKVGVDATMDAACAVDPLALAGDTPPAAHGLETIFAADPRRAPLQARADVPLVTSAGGRAYFVSNGELRSADRGTGEIKEEPPPFLATGTTLAWGAFTTEGEGIALVGGTVVRVASNGDVTTAALPDSLPAALVEEVRAPSNPASGSVQLARIGDTWWLARRDVVSVWPSSIVSRDLHAFDGATALVGGETRGMFLELAAGVLSLRGLTVTGELVALPNGMIAPSPVAFGFEARARDGGGAIVTGPSAHDRNVVIELTIGADGHVDGSRNAAAPAADARRVVCRDGTVRSFETRSSALDTRVEVDIDRADPTSPLADARALVAVSSPAPAHPACPPDMVSVGGKLCIDRFEATLVDRKTGGRLSPDYPVTPSFLATSLADWATGRARWGDVFARAAPLPSLASWELAGAYQPMAVSRPAARPNGFVQGLVAQSACLAAGKRLCTAAEFRTACRGERDRKYPYGPDYVAGACNVERDDHPALLLHGNASFGHLDPRLDRAVGKDGPLVHETGASPKCASAWGDDAVYDLVGNLDEWVDDGTGAFAGGFFARQTREGCDAIIHAHPYEYLDYSIGVRCCEDAPR